MALPISNIDFGRVDAKREIILALENQKEYFLQSFVNPPKFTIKDFTSDRKCFIVGLKGTGKTALLGRLAVNEIQNLQSMCDFVLFKSDFSEDERSSLSKRSGFEIVDDERGKSLFQQDFESTWTLFLAKSICKQIDKIGPARRNGAIQRFYDFVSSLQSDASGKILSLMPKLKNGRVEEPADRKFPAPTVVNH